MSLRTVLLDTSFIVALENKNDPHHERAKALDRELLADQAILLFHWGIVLEIMDG
jgi:predicted nucleic acid-binding protein